MDLYAELHAKYEALESQSPAPIPKQTQSIATQTDPISIQTDRAMIIPPGKEAIQSEDILALEITENTPAPQITNANTENTPPQQITNTMASTGAVDETEMKSAISADSTGITTPTPTITTTTTDPNSNSNSNSNTGTTLEFGEPQEPHLHEATPEQVIGYHGFANLAMLTELPVPLLVCDVFFLYIF